MKKYIKLLYVIAAICLFAVMLVACTPTDGQYTVTYEAGGATGTAPSSEKYDAGESFTLKGADVFTRDGYTFDGWSDGTDVYDAGDEYTMPEKDVTFTARWKENGTNPGGEGTNPGGEGTNPGGEGTNPGGEGTNPGGEGTNPGGEGNNPGGEGTNPGETTSEIEGNWSGAQLSGDLIDAEGANFDVDVAVKQADGGIYVVFGVHGTIQGEDEPISVMMSSAMFMEGDDNEFSAGSGRMNYDGSKLTLTLDLGGEEATTIVFDKKEPLDAAPSVSGSYFATGMNEESVTVDFDAKTLKIVPHQGNNGDDNDNMGSETNKNGNTGSETDTKGDMGDETRGNGDMSDPRDDIALYDRYKINMDQMPQSENDGTYDQMPRSETSEGNPSDDDASDGNSSETANVENVEIVYVGKYIVLFGKEQGGTGDQSGMTGNGGMNDQSGMTGNGGAGDQNGMNGSSDISNRNRGMADQNDLSGNGGIFDYRSGMNDQNGMNSQSGLNGQNNIYGNGTDGRQSINSSDRNIITGDEANASRDYDARMDDYGFNDMRRGDIDVNDDYKTIDGREVDGVANDDISDSDGSDTSGSGTSGSGTSGSDESGNGSDTSGSDESGSMNDRIPLMVIYEGENNTLIGNTSEGDILVFTKQPIMD